MILITGKINEKDLFTRLQESEEGVLRKRMKSPSKPFKHPWQKPLNPLNLIEDIEKEMVRPKNASKGII